MRFTRLFVPLCLVASLVGLTLLSPPVVRGTHSAIVISEFRVRGPLGGNDEFVEIYNRTSSSVNIGGWQLRGSNATGFVSIRATIPAGVILNPGCHYLFTNSTASAGPYSGPVPGDQLYTLGITDDGGLAITLPDGTVMDMAGMSTGSAFKEGTPLANLGTSNLNRGYERKPGGTSGSHQDTDNNSADFQLLTPSDPQSTASTCIVIGDPSGIGAANPSSVAPGGMTLLTVAVTPGSNPTDTNLMVSANLTPIGGAASQMFFDDGTNGDVTSGDLTFSFLATVALGTTPGAKTLSANITDSVPRTGSATINLNVLPPLTPIHTIQGNGSTSPFAGQLVRTQGIVTGVKLNGFFIQTPDEDVDGDPATSEGIFVFTFSVPGAAAIGNNVEVTGTVTEFVPGSDPASPPLTELTSPITTLISMSNPLPTPITLTSAEVSPSGGLDQLERFEGMRVYVSSLTVVGPTLGSISESNATAVSNGVFYGVLTSTARPFREPGIDLHETLPMGTPCCVPRFDTNPERIRVDSDAQVGSMALEVAAGQVVTNLIGPLDFGFRTYTIVPDAASPPSVSGTISSQPVTAPAINEFTVGSFNLQRLFDTVDDPGIPDPFLTPTAFANRLNKFSLAIRDVMHSPDIIGVQEVENLSTLQALANQLNSDTTAGGGTNPLYQAYLFEGNDVGGIDVGFLVKESRVMVNNVTQHGLTDTFINPNTSLPEILNDRPPVVLEATILSPVGPPFPVTVIVNHLRSLSGVADTGTTGNRVRHKRRAQAEFLANLIQSRQAANPNERIVVLGDMNAFEFSDGYVDSIGTIKGMPTPADNVVLASADLVNPDLTNLVDTHPADDRYSFIFDGNAQVLDHILMSANLQQHLSRFEYARSNADFPETFRNDPNSPLRISDHDMPVAAFFLPPIIVQIDIKPGGYPNSINLGSNGTVPVAIFSTATFDAGQVDPSSVSLAGAQVRLRGRGTPMASLQDVNGDGLRDLVVHVETQALQLTSGDVEAVLTGLLYDGKRIRGTDTIRIVP